MPRHLRSSTCGWHRGTCGAASGGRCWRMRSRLPRGRPDDPGDRCRSARGGVLSRGRRAADRSDRRAHRGRGRSGATAAAAGRRRGAILTTSASRDSFVLPMTTTKRKLLWFCIAAALVLAPLGSASAKSAGAAAPYVPGLGEIMGATQMRHLKLLVCRRGAELAVGGLRARRVGRGIRRRGAIPSPPQGRAAPARRADPRVHRRADQRPAAAIAAHDAHAFAAAFDALTAGCNGCHEAARFGFNVVIRPSANPYSNRAVRAGGSRRTNEDTKNTNDHEGHQRRPATSPCGGCRGGECRS